MEKRTTFAELTVKAIGSKAMEINFKILKYRTRYGFSHKSDEEIDINDIFVEGTVKRYFDKYPELDSTPGFDKSNYSGEITGCLATKVDNYIFNDVKQKYSNAIGYLTTGSSGEYFLSFELQISPKQISNLLALKDATFNMKLFPNRIYSETTGLSIEIPVIAAENYSVIPINSYEIINETKL